MAVDKAGRVLELAGVRYLNPADQVFEEMLEGWRNQQLSRNLAFSTIEQRLALVRRFQASVNEFPWQWSAAHVDEFFGDQRAQRGSTHSTLRCYQNALRMFCSYICHPDYGWDRLCERLFNAFPAQVCFEWNTARHVQDSERRPKKRAFTRRELQDFFDRADDEVTRIAESDHKGWRAAMRDSVMFKATYAWGLRMNETTHLQTVDFSRNPHAREFGRFGVAHVRFGKAMRGSPPKARSVLTVFDWSGDIVEEWLDRGYDPVGLDLFTTERGTLVSEPTLLRRFRRYCQDLSLSEGLDLHSLRRSYATHLIESGMDPLFVQHQLGHEYASTTALYTCVSSDFRTSTLRRALDSTLNEALNRGE